MTNKICVNSVECLLVDSRSCTTLDLRLLSPQALFNRVYWYATQCKEMKETDQPMSGEHFVF